MLDYNHFILSKSNIQCYNLHNGSALDLRLTGLRFKSQQVRFHVT